MEENKIMTQEYNGWTNKETWLVNLHCMQDFHTDLKEWCWEDMLKKETIEEQINFYEDYLESQLEEHINEFDEEEESTALIKFLRALLMCSLKIINFNELAKRTLEDYRRDNKL